MYEILYAFFLLILLLFIRVMQKNCQMTPDQWNVVSTCFIMSVLMLGEFHIKSFQVGNFFELVCHY